MSRIKRWKNPTIKGTEKGYRAWLRISYSTHFFSHRVRRRERRGAPWEKNQKHHVMLLAFPRNGILLDFQNPLRHLLWICKFSITSAFFSWQNILFHSFTNSPHTYLMHCQYSSKSALPRSDWTFSLSASPNSLSMFPVSLPGTRP